MLIFFYHNCLFIKTQFLYNFLLSKRLFHWVPIVCVFLINWEIRILNHHLHWLMCINYVFTDLFVLHMHRSRGGGQCVWAPLKDHKAKGFLSNTGPEPLNNHKCYQNSEYDKEIPQSQTVDKPMAQRGRATQQSRDTMKTNCSKASKSLFPVKMIA